MSFHGPMGIHLAIKNEKQNKTKTEGEGVNITQWMKPLSDVRGSPGVYLQHSINSVATCIHSPSPWKVEAGGLEFKVGLGHVKTWLAQVGKGTCHADLHDPHMIPTGVHMVKGENQVPTSCSVTSCAHIQFYKCKTQTRGNASLFLPGGSTIVST